MSLTFTLTTRAVEQKWMCHFNIYHTKTKIKKQEWRKLSFICTSKVQIHPYGHNVLQRSLPFSSPLLKLFFRMSLKVETVSHLLSRSQTLFQACILALSCNNAYSIFLAQTIKKISYYWFLLFVIFYPPPWVLHYSY